MDETMAEACARYIAERGLLLTPDDAHDMCLEESEAFLATLTRLGIDAELVSGLLVIGAMVIAGHFAVRVADEVWDWTARQFVADAAVPLVTPWHEWHAAWGWFGTEDGIDPLALACDCMFHRAMRGESLRGESLRGESLMD